MEKVGILSYILIVLVFLFSFSANLSTEHPKRRQLYIGAFAAGIFFFGLSASDFFHYGFTEAWAIVCVFFAGIGILLPQLISRIFARQKMKHPVIFLPKRKVAVIPLTITAGLLAFMAWVALSLSDHVLWSFSFSVFLISFILMAIQAQVERDAICENGFYQAGLLSDWSNFKSYLWSQGKMYSDPSVQPLLDQNTLIELILEPKNTSFTKQIRLTIPFSEKNTIENLLSKKLATEQGNSHTFTTA